MEMKRALFKYLDDAPECNISGWELYEIMVARTGKRAYPQTLLNYAREYANISGAEFSCIDAQSSTYHYKPFLKISTALISGRE